MCVAPWKLFTKHVACMTVEYLVVNLRHDYSCHTLIVNLKIWQITLMPPIHIVLSFTFKKR